MTLNLEPGWRLDTAIIGTPLQLIDLTAQITTEMMVMPELGLLIARRHPRDDDRDDDPLLLQRIQRPIDRRLTQSRHLYRSKLQHLIRIQGTIRLLKDRPNRLALSGCPLHVSPPRVGLFRACDSA